MHFRIQIIERRTEQAPFPFKKNLQGPRTSVHSECISNHIWIIPSKAFIIKNIKCIHHICILLVCISVSVLYSVRLNTAFTMIAVNVILFSAGKWHTQTRSILMEHVTILTDNLNIIPFHKRLSQAFSENQSVQCLQQP